MEQTSCRDSTRRYSGAFTFTTKKPTPLDKTISEKGVGLGKPQRVAAQNVERNKRGEITAGDCDLTKLIAVYHEPRRDCKLEPREKKRRPAPERVSHEINKGVISSICLVTVFSDILFPNAKRFPEVAQQEKWD